MTPLTKEQLAFLAERLPMVKFNYDTLIWYDQEVNFIKRVVEPTEYAHLVSLVEGQLNRKQKQAFVKVLCNNPKYCRVAKKNVITCRFKLVFAELQDRLDALMTVLKSA